MFAQRRLAAAQGLPLWGRCPEGAEEVVILEQNHIAEGNQNPIYRNQPPFPEGEGMGLSSQLADSILHGHVYYLTNTV